MMKAVRNFLFNSLGLLFQGFNQFCGCCALIFCPFFLFAQYDTTKLEGVTVIGHHKLIDEQAKFDREEILSLASIDLGVLLKNVAGANIADYGGIGSMKTVSMRGMGTTHTGFLVNGYPRNNSQSGQIDFGKIQINNLESAAVRISPSSDISIPVSSKMKGSVVIIETFEQTFSQKPISLRSSVTMGSFGRKEVNSSIKIANPGAFLSFSGNIRDYNGDFQYSLPYETDSIRRRANNDMNEMNLAIGGGKKWRSRNGNAQRVKLYGSLDRSHRSLPGAIILYNGDANEKLFTSERSIGVDHLFIGKSLSMRSFATYNNHQLRYIDPEYFNLEGEIDNSYLNNSIHTGFNGKLKKNIFSFLFGNDLRSSSLNSSRDLGNPSRLSNFAMIGMDIDLDYFSTNLTLFHHHLKDQNIQLSHDNKYDRFNPQVQITTTDKLLAKTRLALWFKRSSRAPTFNELYYSQIGNTLLAPEESEQLNLGYFWVFDKNMISGKISGNIFYNRLKNKIVSIPTQNLFVWSIQNVGKVLSYGKDITVDLEFDISGKSSISFSSTNTYQIVQDQSDRNSPSFGHQIANTPKFTNSSNIKFDINDINIQVSSLYIGERYALNENIQTNLLEAYFILNTSCRYSFEIKKENILSVQAGVRNLLAKQYFHINYFVMPGRNYFIKLSYEI